MVAAEAEAERIRESTRTGRLLGENGFLREMEQDCGAGWWQENQAGQLGAESQTGRRSSLVSSKRGQTHLSPAPTDWDLRPVSAPARSSYTRTTGHGDWRMMA